MIFTPQLWVLGCWFACGAVGALIEAWMVKTIIDREIEERISAAPGLAILVFLFALLLGPFELVWVVGRFLVVCVRFTVAQAKSAREGALPLPTLPDPPP